MGARHLAELESIRSFHRLRMDGLAKALNELDSPSSSSSSSSSSSNIADFERDTIRMDLEFDLGLQEDANRMEREAMLVIREMEREGDRLAEESELNSVRAARLASFNPMQVRNAYMLNKSDVGTVMCYMINYSS
jgi:hypothetical protein